MWLYFNFTVIVFRKHHNQEEIVRPSDVNNATGRGKEHFAFGDGATLHMVAEADRGAEEQGG